MSDNAISSLTIALTGLRPFSDYNVTVTATNRAGSASGFVEFTTLEDGELHLTLSLRICCKFAHFLISTIAKEILN